jgi:hypothetical protein
MTNSIEKEILLDIINNPNDTFYENVLSDFLDEQNIEHYFRKPLDNNNIVTELKPYQEKYLDIWANHWTNIGLCTKPTDESKTELYFYYFYKELGFSTPKNIVWFNNPIEMWFKIIINLSNQVFINIWNKTSNQLWNQVSEQVGSKIWNWIWDRVGKKVFSQIFGQVLDKIKNQVLRQVKNQVSNYVWGWGQLD